MKNDLCYRISFGKQFHLKGTCDNDCSSCTDCRSDNYFCLRVDGDSDMSFRPEYCTRFLSRHFIGEILGVCIDVRNNNDLAFVQRNLDSQDNDAMSYMLKRHRAKFDNLVIAHGYYYLDNEFDLTRLFENLGSILNTALGKKGRLAVYLMLNDVEFDFAVKHIEALDNIVFDETFSALICFLE